MPAVSVIVAVYNSEKYVRACIRSIQRQTLKDIEIIVIDDGSTDRSGGILEKIALSDPRIRLVRQENQGVAAVRNRGVSMATGEYLTFVDGDDLLERHYLENLYKKAQQTDADLVITGLTFAAEDGRVLRRLAPGESENPFIWAMRVSAVCSRLYRTSVWRKLDVQFVPGERGEDMPVSLLTSMLFPRVVLADGAGYDYIQHEGSASHHFRGLREFSLPYQGLLRTFETVRTEGISPERQEYYELFVLRILATCFFNLGRGAEKEKLAELTAFIEKVLHDYIPDYASNPHTRLFTADALPFSQKAAVVLLVQLAEHEKLGQAAKLLDRL